MSIANQGLFYKIGVYFTSVIVLFVLFWSVDKGMIFSDEAFYLFHHDPQLYKFRFSNWHVLYSPLLFSNFIVTKYVLLSIICLSAYFLGYSSAKYFKLAHAHFIGILTVIAQFILIYPIGYTPSYSTLNTIAINLGITFFLTYLINRNTNWLIICGFFLACLPLLMIPNAAIALPFLILLYLTSEKKLFNKALIKLLFGVILLYLIYFLFLDTPQIFYNKFIEAVDYLSYIDTHGGSPMIEWHIEIVVNFIAGAITLLLLLLSKKYCKFSIYALAFMFTVLLYYTYRSVFNYDTHFYTTPFYLLILSLYLFYINKKESRPNLVLAFFILVPYFVSLGTEVDFFIRSSIYFPFLFIAGVVLLQNSSKNLKLIFIGLYSISILNFLSFPFRKNWEGYRLIDQKYITEYKGAKYYLNEERYNNLQKLKPYLENEKFVLVSHQNLWGYVLNSNATPPMVHFRPNKYVIKFIKENNIPLEDLVFLELDHRPFDKEFLDELTHKKMSGFKKVELGEFNIYKELE